MLSIQEIAKDIVSAFKAQVKKFADEYNDRLTQMEKAYEAIPDYVKRIASDAVHRELSDKPEIETPDFAALVAEEVKKQLEALSLPEVETPDFAALVAEEVKKKVDELPVAKDGEDGKDALHLEIMPEIDTERSYKRGTYAMHKGGLWRSFQKTNGMTGWEVLVDGIADIEIAQTDDRDFRIKAVKSSGEVVEKTAHFPVMIYKGVFKQGESYNKGDAATWAGSVWVAQEDTADAPGQASKAWKLAVKAGRNASEPVKVKHA